MTAVPMKTSVPCVVPVTQTNPVNTNKARNASCEGSEGCGGNVREANGATAATPPLHGGKLKERVFVSREDNYAGEARLYLKCQ